MSGRKSSAASSEPNRVFLGWDRPLLASAVAELHVSRARGKQWDLSGVVVVLPVHRAAKRLATLLRDHAAEEGLQLKLPKLITVGGLPELLYEPRHPLASELQQTLAWTNVLSRTPDSAIEPLMPTVLPREPIAPWVEMASTLRRLCEDLAADAITPQDVISQVQGGAEQDRWRLIADLYQRYLGVLDGIGLADPHHQRRLALEEERCVAPGAVILIGCVDLGTQICHMLQKIAPDVSLFIGAPEDHDALFDVCGRVVPGRWQEMHVEIADGDLVPAGDAEQQAALAAETVDRWRGDTSMERITVGITDDSFAPLVETELMLCGIHAHRVAGTPITRTAPGRLLELVRDCLATPTWLALSALMRHSTVLSSMAPERQGTHVLTQLDQLRATHFPVRLDDPLPSSARADSYAALFETKDRVRQWLDPMMGPPRRFSIWCGRLREMLRVLFVTPDAEGERVPALPVDIAAVHAFAVEEIDGLLDRFADLASDLDVTVTAYAAIDMVLARLADPRTVVKAEPEAVEIAGWLDLAMDDSPAIVVVGFNHPFVPQSVTADPFLPGSLRSRLRVADNERRFARDAYVLQVIQKTRSVKAMIVGRAGPDGSPTPPSRLLAACPSTVTLRRVKRLLDPPPREQVSGDDEDAAAVPLFRNRWFRQTDVTTLNVPKPETSKTLTSISVTAFQAYLICPYRFYLRHVLGLRPLDDAAGELAANQFGDLIHGAVERYGQSDDKDLCGAEEIADRLIVHLNEYAVEQYGDRPTAAVRVQIAQAEKRLVVAADRQAERMQAGWRIHSVEAAVRESAGAAISLPDGRKLLLKGRVDRIDYHPDSERWAILDYKTHGHKPMEKHYDAANGKWLELQLPLYLRMLAALNIDALPDQVDVGYFNIASNPAETGVHLAELTPSLLESAFACAEEVARGVLDARFELNPDAAAVTYDDYAAILQTGVAQNLLAEIEE